MDFPIKIRILGGIALSHFNMDLFQVEKIVIKYIFSCVHYTSLESNDKLVAVD